MKIGARFATIFYILLVVGGLILARGFKGTKSKQPADPESFYNEFNSPQALETKVNCTGFFEKLGDVTSGTYAPFDRAETRPAKEFPIPARVLQELKMALGNHLSYGLEYASLRQIDFRLRLSNNSEHLVLTIAENGVEFQFEEAFGTAQKHMWFSSSRRLMEIFSYFYSRN